MVMIAWAIKQEQNRRNNIIIKKKKIKKMAIQAWTSLSITKLKEKKNLLIRVKKNINL